MLPNIQQMLSNLYLHYQMSVIIKTKDGICLKCATLIVYDDENIAELDLKILNAFI